MRIFLLEDDDAIGMGLKYSLEKEGYETVLSKTVKEALSKVKKDDFDLYILDINLPDGNGYDVCKAVKDKGDLPVIFLTASDAEVSVVMGLEMGADDYICKPFRVNELMARIKTVLRRSARSSASDARDTEGLIEIRNIRIHTAGARVTCVKENGAEEPVELTALEYRLLLAFCSNRGVVMSRTKLLEDMWDVSGDFVNDNTLTVYIKRLRDKIEEDPADPKIIKTVRGLGYIVE
ncbi:MAG: response regulator transcription factor [Lachnospiraceae bacterium]|nr:response regulator transcription factor [Lachnospiraceae bacterium]